MNLSDLFFKYLKPYLFLIPSLLLIILIGLIPMGMVVYYSVHDSFFGGNYIWVGLDWFKQLFHQLSLCYH